MHNDVHKTWHEKPELSARLRKNSLHEKEAKKDLSKQEDFPPSSSSKEANASEGGEKDPLLLLKSALINLPNSSFFASSCRPYSERI